MTDDLERKVSQISAFYDEMAEHYHLIFQDWEVAMRRQGDVIASLLPPPTQVGPILDCACGIGTQSLALATLGFQVDASDLSPSEAARAQREAAARGLPIRVWVDDMRMLEKAPAHHYGAVLCMDNALPHLDSDADIDMALRAMSERLRPGGLLILSLRDYGLLMADGLRPCRLRSSPMLASAESYSSCGTGSTTADTRSISTSPARLIKVGRTTISSVTTAPCRPKRCSRWWLRRGSLMFGFFLRRIPDSISRSSPPFGLDSCVVPLPNTVETAKPEDGAAQT